MSKTPSGKYARARDYVVAVSLDVPMRSVLETVARWGVPFSELYDVQFDQKHQVVWFAFSNFDDAAKDTE